MAEVVGTFDQKIVSGKRGIYPWDEWLDGRIWKLTKGVDFQCKLDSFRMACVYAAANRGVKLRLQRRGEVVTIQANGSE